MEKDFLKAPKIYPDDSDFSSDLYGLTFGRSKSHENRYSAESAKNKIYEKSSKNEKT